MPRRPTATLYGLAPDAGLGVKLPEDAMPKGKAKASRPLEAVVQKHVMKVLADFGLWHMRNNTGAMAVGQGSSRRFVRFSEKGAADILFRLPDGRMGWCEVKRQGGKLDEHQLAWLLAQQAGGAVAIWVNEASQLQLMLQLVLAGGSVELHADGIMSYGAA